jgi:dihydroorotate dehydrogenase electron transfer subunit
VVKRQVPAPGHVELWVHSPVLAGATPGQFAHVVTQGTLRRPISFSRLDVDTGNAAMLFQVVGVGTRWLANQEMGAVLDILGPLGRGFPVPDARRPWCLVGGGVGIPPLFAAASQWTSAARMTPTAILGARTESLVLLEEEFRQLGHVVWITTDDGSRGMKGTVIGPLARWLAKNPQGQVYACGPTAMLRAVGAISGQRDDVWMALEQRMGCGVGACLACVVLGNGPEGPDYRRVCTEGPVFSGEELIFP